MNHSQILNYVWIPGEPVSDGDTHPIHDAYLDNICKVAKDHPNVKILLWIDFSLLSHLSRQGISDYIRQPSTDNVEICNLQDISVYREDLLFKKQSRLPHDYRDPIWQKIDLAKLLVIQHVLKTQNADEVFYSDIDIVDPPISFIRLKNLMNEYGMVFNKSDRNGACKEDYLENQFMGFKRGSEGFLTDILIPQTKDSIAEGGDGWSSLRTEVNRKFGEHSPFLNKVTVITRELSEEISVRGINPGGVKSTKPYTGETPASKSSTKMLNSNKIFYVGLRNDVERDVVRAFPVVNIKEAIVDGNFVALESALDGLLKTRLLAVFDVLAFPESDVKRATIEFTNCFTLEALRRDAHRIDEKVNEIIDKHIRDIASIVEPDTKGPKSLLDRITARKDSRSV